MKNKYVWLLLISFIAYACEQAEENLTSTPPETVDTWLKKSSIYEVNIRQYTPEGTINALLPHLDRLKELDVDILWLMPLQPLGVLNRKGSMGSYYSIRNYTAINPELGTEEDFKNFMEQSHEMGFKVIMDWVPNHSAWDHQWVKEHPEFYAEDSIGKSPIMPPGTDWSDVAQLNYENIDLQNAMIKEMSYWIEKFDIDGFRCDQAGLVPMDFWVKAVDSLNSIKPIFMLAEWQEPKMHRAFHMTYTWEFHHELREIAKGVDPQQIVMNRMEQENNNYPDSAYRMVFTTNHDENAWQGSVFERYGENVAPVTVLTFTLFGTPLVYSGQEIGLDRSLRFFEKDTIEWKDSQWTEFYKKLLMLHEQKRALWGNGFGAPVSWINGPEGTICYSRGENEDEIFVFLNFTDEPMEIDVQKLNFNSYMKDSTSSFQDSTLVLSAHGYYIGETEKN